MPSAGALKNFVLVANCFNNTLVGCNIQANWQVSAQVLVNSNPTPLGCSVSITALNQPFACVDSSDTVPVNAGDTVSVSMSSSVSFGGGSGFRLNVALEKQ
jgi:hypothetical protein